jgi:copper chaperone
MRKGIGLLLLIAVAGCGNEVGTVANTLYRVGDMSCGDCEQKVEETVMELDGVHKAEASHETGQLKVSYDPDEVTPQAIREALAKEGYPAREYRAGS